MGHHTLPSQVSDGPAQDGRSLRDQEAVRNAGLPAGGITCQDKAQEKLACGPVPE